MNDGTKAAALLYLLRLDLSRWRHARWTDAYNARRRAGSSRGQEPRSPRDWHRDRAEVKRLRQEVLL